MMKPCDRTDARVLRNYIERNHLIGRCGRLAQLTLAILITALVLGCAGTSTVNPSFAVSSGDAKAAWRDMKSHPRPFARPVVVLGGIYDPGIVASHIASELREITTVDSPVIAVSFFTNGSFDSCVKRLLLKVDAAFPTDDPHHTVEVDVVAFSMGGLVARDAASSSAAIATGGRTLRIRRLFTVGTPHRGARLAGLPTFDRRVMDMRAGSTLLRRLDAEPRAFEIIAYGRLGDRVVGVENSSPVDQGVWWLPSSWTLPHLMGGRDTRILADIARRLRGESPLTGQSPAPLPTSQSGRSAARER